MNPISGQKPEAIVKEYTSLKKRVFNYTKINFITEEGEFDESNKFHYGRRGI